MQYPELIGKLQMLLRLNSAAKAERRMLVTLSALSELMSPEAARKLGPHLPAEIAERLDYGLQETASWEDFTEIVAEKEGAGVIAEDAEEHALAVMKVVGEAYGKEDEAGGATGESAEEDLTRFGQSSRRSSSRFSTGPPEKARRLCGLHTL